MVLFVKIQIHMVLFFYERRITVSHYNILHNSLSSVERILYMNDDDCGNIKEIQRSKDSYMEKLIFFLSFIVNIVE